MTMTNQELKKLLDKYLSNQCSKAETDKLFDQLQQQGSDKELLENIQQEFLNDDFRQRYTMPPASADRIRERLKAHAEEIAAVPLYPSRKWRLAGIAAAVVLVMFSINFYRNVSKEKDTLSAASIGGLKNDVKPGDSKAVLTLADGRTIVLDNVKSGILASQGQTAISKTADGQIVYDASAKPLENASAPLTYNTITTPRGGQYMVVLPDGTKVWLNAASSLRFPTAFTGKERRVELSGEAYFEVAKSGIPFLVNSAGQQIEVLGTHFNVMAYEDEASVKTTLLEGSVKVSNLKSHISHLLRPGQQSSLSRDGSLKVTEVNTEEAAAWKNGYFIFANENIQSSMKKIARWYDVEIEYQGNVKNKALWGTISRFENISEVLKMIELTGVIHLKLEERRVIVMP